MVRWPLQPLQPLQKHSSNHLSVHQWIHSAIRDSQQLNSPIGLLFLKLPPPPCAGLLVYSTSWHLTGVHPNVRPCAIRLLWVGIPQATMAVWRVARHLGSTQAMVIDPWCRCPINEGRCRWRYHTATLVAYSAIRRFTLVEFTSGTLWNYEIKRLLALDANKIYTRDQNPSAHWTHTIPVWGFMQRIRFCSPMELNRSAILVYMVDRVT